MISKTVNREIKGMIDLMSELREDNSVPRNVKDKLQFCSQALQEKCDVSLKVDKVRGALEEISEDSNLQPYTRTQIWNIASALEKI